MYLFLLLNVIDVLKEIPIKLRNSYVTCIDSVTEPVPKKSGPPAGRGRRDDYDYDYGGDSYGGGGRRGGGRGAGGRSGGGRGAGGRGGRGRRDGECFCHLS